MEANHIWKNGAVSIAPKQDELYLQSGKLPVAFDILLITCTGGHDAWFWHWDSPEGFPDGPRPYRELVEALADSTVHPEDRQKWLDAALPGNLLRYFATGNRRFCSTIRILDRVKHQYLRCQITMAATPAPDGHIDAILIAGQLIAEAPAALDTAFYTDCDRTPPPNLTETKYQMIVQQTGMMLFEWIHTPGKPPVSEVSFWDNMVRYGYFSCDTQLLENFRLPRADCAALLELGPLVHPEDLKEYRHLILPLRHGQQHRQVLLRLRDRTGIYLWNQISLYAIQDECGQLARVLGMVLNVDDETRTRRALLLHNIRYRTILEQTKTIEFEFDAYTGLSYVSPMLEQVFNISAGPFFLPDGFRRSMIVHPDDHAVLDGLFEACWREHKRRQEVVCRFLDRQGRFTWFRLTMDAFAEDGQLVRILGALHDVDEHMRAVHALSEKLQTDPLTGIWNQEKFLNAASTLLERDGGNFAFIMMDIYKFKVINDIHGMEGGNRALRYIGDALRAIFGENGCYGRIYADVFGILIPYQDDAGVEQVLQQIAHALYTREFDFMLIPCFGVCRQTGPHDTGAAEMMERAGFAHKTAKANGIHRWAFYNDGMRRRAIEDKQMESELDAALAGNQFIIYLQPKYDLASRQIVGAEALVRWQHPEKGLIPPGRFIPLFEQNGAIIRMDMYVWETACRRLRMWLDAGIKPLPISINMSRMHIRNTYSHRFLTGLLEKYRLPPRFIELELTESLICDVTDEVLSSLFQFRNAGFLLSMDDFGAGYSSLNMLRRLPLDILKIDCGFFSDSGNVQRGQVVVRHTVAMAHELEMHIVAEGVETAEQTVFLEEIGCDAVQGFYFSKPLPVDAFERLAFGKSLREPV